MDKKIHTNKGVIYLWKNNTFLKIDKKKRRNLEKITVEKKLKEDFPKAFITHSEKGAPILKQCDFQHISVSHYKNLFAFYMADYPVGIDIQLFKSNLNKGKHFFVNLEEEGVFDFNVLNLHLIWSTKEVIYKKYSGKIKDFKNEITVLEIDDKTEKITAKYQQQTENLHFKKTEEFVLVWS